MREYTHTTLALIDFEIAKTISEKEYLEKKIIALYEARENAVGDLQMQEQLIHDCDRCEK